MVRAPQFGKRRIHLSKQPINQHKEYAQTGKPSQETSKGGAEPPKTNFDGTNGRRADVPHTKGKE